jgi:hypothetical protein
MTRREERWPRVVATRLDLNVLSELRRRARAEHVPLATLLRQVLSWFAQSPERQPPTIQKESQ